MNTSATLNDFSLKTIDSLGDRKMVAEADLTNVNTTQWSSDHANAVQQQLNDYGALLVRGLVIRGSKKLGRVLEALFGTNLLEYSFRTTPRTKMRGRVYTSTEYHQDQTIMPHNENAYSNRWPMRIAFYCVKPSETLGSTPFVDSRKIYRDLPVELRDELQRKKLLYVRNYGDIDLAWSEVFQTEDRSVVEAYCDQNAIVYEWLEGGRLRTTQTNSAICQHPNTGESLWFNQAHMFHISSLDSDTRESLLNVMPESDLPKSVYFGDGTPIPDTTIAHIRDVYEQNLNVFNWKEGDLLLLDNMRFAHGRQPFTGERRILTGMAGEMMSSNPMLHASQHGASA